MPIFTAKPVTIEAFQWRGVYADLPSHAARLVELQGWRPPLVHVGDGTKIPMEEGSWLVIGTDGRPEVVPNGAFDRRYEAVKPADPDEVLPEAVPAIAAEVMIPVEAVLASVVIPRPRGRPRLHPKPEPERIEL